VTCEGNLLNDVTKLCVLHAHDARAPPRRAVQPLRPNGKNSALCCLSALLALLK
jgi:hypothetical protein